MKTVAQSVVALAALAALGANAADFPIKDKPISLVVPFAAGGPTDRVARDLAEAMRKSLGGNVSVVVENAAGGPGGLKPVIGQVMGAVWQVVVSGTKQQQAEAAEILADTRRRLYGLLAEGDEEDEGDEES